MFTRLATKYFSGPYRSFGRMGVRFFSQQFVKNDNKRVLLDLASDFARRGKVRTSEDIYKEVIDKHPRDIEAYNKLWCSWAHNRALRVTKSEMDEFLTKHKENFDDITPKPLQPK